MKKNNKLYLIAFTPLVATSVLTVSACEKAQKPNILVVLCDDLGYNDVSFNGSKDIRTPNLDSLAKSGVVFNSAYVAHPFSGPSRASLLTGRYPHVIGTPYNLRDEGYESDLGVPVSETYISNVLQNAGYFTSAIGKWHLGDGERFTPNKRGFDEFYGFLGGGHKYFPEEFNKMYLNQVQAGKYPINGYLLPLKHNKETVDEKEYITDALSREAINSINMSKDKKKPFFIYLAYNAPHVPLEAKIEDLAQFPDIKDNDRKAYAAMVYAVDRGVGDIVKTLRANNQLDNTLIVFLSDNGGNTDHGANNDPLKGTKGDTWEGGYRTPMFFHWPAKIQAGKRYDDLVSALDLYPTFVNMAGAKLPKGKVLDGVDIMNDVIDGKAKDKERMIFALRYREGYSDVGVRQGDWKATRMGNEPWGLYNVSKDMGEHKDLSGQNPEKLKKLVAAAVKWSQSHVKPLWVYSQADEEMWDNGTLPNYKETFEVDKLLAPPSNYKLTK